MSQYRAVDKQGHTVWLGDAKSNKVVKWEAENRYRSETERSHKALPEN